MNFRDYRFRPEINYPCEWIYKVIGKNADKLITAVEDATSGLDYDLTPSNISKKGNYLSLNLIIEVPNQVVRDLIYEKLQNHPAIKFVL